MRELPIKGECLQTAAIDCDGNKSITTWNILRNKAGEDPRLGEPTQLLESDKQMFFLVPAMRGMGIQPDFIEEPDATDGS